MTAFYGLYGEMRLRKCLKVDEIIRNLRLMEILDVDVYEGGPGIVRLALDGCGLLSHAAGIQLGELVESLGPFTLEPAILITDYEHEEDVLVVAASEAEKAQTLSRHRLEQISKLISEVLREDRARLVAMASAGGP